MCTKKTFTWCLDLFIIYCITNKPILVFLYVCRVLSATFVTGRNSYISSYSVYVLLLFSLLNWYFPPVSLHEVCTFSTSIVEVEAVKNS